MASHDTIHDHANDAARIASLTGTGSATDQDVLDVAFQQMLEAFEEGQPFRTEHLLSQHPHLHQALDELLDLAGEIAIGPRAGEPLPTCDDIDVISRLGSGGMGSVYLARQRSLGGRPVALKVLPKWLASRSSKERFQREARAIAGLRHPNIITIHQFIELNDSFAYTMEFVAGGTLQRLIDASMTTHMSQRPALIHDLLQAGEGVVIKDYARQIAAWGAAIADAMHAMHGAGLIHRDIKPSNILIRADATPLLSDFGLVFQVDQHTLTMPGAFAGSVAYAPPEQLRGNMHSLTPHADVYSLGATLFQALTGRLPYLGASAVQVLASIEKGCDLRSLMREVPPDLTLIVCKALAPEPSLRYATAGEMSADLQRFLSNRPVLARPTSIRYRIAKYLRRHRAASISAVVAALLAIVLATGLSVRLFLFPRWSEAAMTRARLMPHQRTIPGQNTSGVESHSGLQSAAFWGLVYPGDAERTASDDSKVFQDSRFSSAIREYERASFFGDASGKADAERNALEFVMDDQRADAKVWDQWAASSPAFRICRDLQQSRRQWTASLRVATPRALGPKLNHTELAQLSPNELRQLALACYFRSMPEAALDSWAELERRGEDDAFTSGMLGMLYLMNDRPELAYPRLRTAMVAYPQSPHFTMFTADAAAQVGDSVKASQYLAAARATGIYDEYASLRIESLLRLGTGDVEGVMRSVRESRCAAGGRTWSPILFTQLARRMMAMREGEPERSGELDSLIVECATLAAADSPAALRAVELLKEVGLSWWQGLSDEQRMQIARLHVQPATTPNGFGCDWEHLFITAVLACDSVGQLIDPRLASIAERSHILDSLMHRGQVDGDAARARDNVSQAYARRAGLRPQRVEELARWLLTGEGKAPSDEDWQSLPVSLRPEQFR